MTYLVSEDPPRPPDGSAMQQDMAGYMCARGDFCTEYDNYAELDLRDIDFDNDDSEDTLERGTTLLSLLNFKYLFFFPC